MEMSPGLVQRIISLSLLNAAQDTKVAPNDLDSVELGLMAGLMQVKMERDLLDAVEKLDQAKEQFRVAADALNAAYTAHKQVTYELDRLTGSKVIARESHNYVILLHLIGAITTSEMMGLLRYQPKILSAQVAQAGALLHELSTGGGGCTHGETQRP